MNENLSYPPLSSIQYTSFDTVINTISKLGKGTLVAKSDIKSALPVYPGVFDLLGFHFKGAYYINKMLPFGCPIFCKMFEIFSTFLNGW